MVSYSFDSKQAVSARAGASSGRHLGSVLQWIAVVVVVMIVAAVRIEVFLRYRSSCHSCHSAASLFSFCIFCTFSICSLPTVVIASNMLRFVSVN